MELFYDISKKTYSLRNNGEMEYLGPHAMAMLALQEYGYTVSQAREAVLQAAMNGGDAVRMDVVTKIARYLI